MLTEKEDRIERDFSIFDFCGPFIDTYDNKDLSGPKKELLLCYLKLGIRMFVYKS